MTDIEFADVFISYARADQDFATAFAECLRKKGLAVAIDRHLLASAEGQSWREPLVKAIQGTDRLVLILTPNSAQSKEVLNEIALAEQYDRQILVLSLTGGRPGEFPANILPDLKWRLSARQQGALHVTAETSPEAAAASLIALVQKGLAKDPDPRRSGNMPVYVRRESLVGKLRSKIEAARMAGRKYALLLHGPSGSGKSNLAHDIANDIDCDVRRVSFLRARSGIIRARDLLLVDDFLGGTDLSQDAESNPKLMSSARPWLQEMCAGANSVIVTARHSRAPELVRSYLSDLGFEVETHATNGLDLEEFTQGIAQISRTPGWKPLSKDEVLSLYQQTTGLPLCLQIISWFARNEPGLPGVSLSIQQIARGHICNHLLDSWRQTLTKQDKAAARYLNCLAVTPVVAMDDVAAAHVLNCSLEEVSETRDRMAALGFVSMVDTIGAFKIHDSIKAAFQDMDEFIHLKPEFRKRYHQVSQPQFQYPPSRARSYFTLLDSIQALSRDYFIANTSTLTGVSVYDYLDGLSNAMIGLLRGGTDSIEDVERLELVITEHLRNLVETHPDYLCSSMLSLAPVCEIWPRTVPAWSEAVAPLWEQGEISDMTIFAPAMMMALRHLGAFSDSADPTHRQRLDEGYTRFNWKEAGCPDLALAAFAAAYSRIGEHLRIVDLMKSDTNHKYPYVPVGEAFASLIIALDERQSAKDGGEQAAILACHYERYLQSAEPVTKAYLCARFPDAKFGHPPADSSFLPMRANIIGQWTRSTSFRTFAREAINLAKKPPQGVREHQISGPDLLKLARKHVTPVSSKKSVSARLMKDNGPERAPSPRPGIQTERPHVYLVNAPSLPDVNDLADARSSTTSIREAYEALHNYYQQEMYRQAAGRRDVVIHRPPSALQPAVKAAAGPSSAASPRSKRRTGNVALGCIVILVLALSAVAYYRPWM
ncbi:TIR domain-containing protein [Hyphomonas sp.]|uniref:TIR domain-containing protein n=1 Tax=Hyphomonas sp. TaxID=87 RepID=UPI00391D3B54